MKLGRSGGSDGLDPEHVCFGGEVLKLWFVRVFNRMIALAPTLLIIPIHKGKGNAPGSYRGITLSSVLFELHRLSPAAGEKVSPLSTPFKRLYLCMQEHDMGDTDTTGVNGSS